MRFSEKIDFLMNLTKTSNSALSVITYLDPSHISRLRRGQRGLSKTENYIGKMSEYFAKICIQNYQLKVLCDVLEMNPFSVDNENISEHIREWLLKDKGSYSDSIESFINEFAKPQNKIPYHQTFKDNITAEDDVLAKISAYYGISGKQQAVNIFLSEVLMSGETQTLLLYSDEDMDWMTGDEFRIKWAQLMVAVLSRGHKIIIIHNVSRNLDEMLSAISQWMPLYMSGAITPYYYPKKRDGIFKRTLFIAPKTAAVISTSVGNMTDKAANFLIHDQEAIDAIIEEYKQYISMCIPLMRIFTSKTKSEYFECLLDFEQKLSESIIATTSLSLLTMPEDLVKQALLHTHNEEYVERLKNYYRTRKALFDKNIETKRFLEIIKLPDPADVLNGKVKITFSDMLSNSLCYDPNQYADHLEHIIEMLEKYKNYHICLTDTIIHDSYIVYAKEDIGVIVAKTSAPEVILFITEGNLKGAFWDYLINKINFSSPPDNAQNCKTLRSYVRQLKVMME